MVIKNLLILLLLLPTSALAALNYQLELDLQPALHQLTAKARITFKGEVRAPRKLRLAARCEIISLRQGEQNIPYSFNGGLLQFTPRGEEPVSISYRELFNDQAAHKIPAHDEDPSFGIAANLSPRGTYLSSGGNWYPQITAEDIRYRISVTAPAGYQALTSGRRIAHQTSAGKTTSVWLIDYPIGGLTLAAGPLLIFEDLSGRVPIYAYFNADSAPLAATYLEAARSYLNLYIKLFGPYPFHKFAIVENFFPTGYGLPSWTLLGSSVIKLPFIVKTSLGHEIAHSWWGIGVQVDRSQGNWAEGLTTYVADYLYKELDSAAAARAYRQTILRDYANLVTADNEFAVNRFSSRYDKASQAIGYGKAAMVFHMLRKRVGEEVFWRGLKQLATERMHTRVGWDDFSQLFSTLSGQNLQLFFDQWLSKKGGPRLSLQEVKREKTAEGWRLSGILAQQPTYQLQIDLQLTTATETKHQTLMIDAARQAFSFETTDPPLTLEADPEGNLFRILKKNEIPTTVNSIRGSDNLLVLRAKESAPDSTAIKTLLAALRKPDLTLRSIEDVSRQELASHDLLIFGLPRQLRPEQLQTGAEGQLSLEGQQLKLAEQSAFIVTRNPLNSAMSAAWFISEDSQAAVVARKVPHYGKYSTLLFDGTKNRLKITQEQQESTLRIKF